MVGGAWEPYLAPRLIGVINGIWMYIVISAQNTPQVKHCMIINVVFGLIFIEYRLLLFLLNDTVNNHK